MVCRLCFNLNWCCKPNSYIPNNRKNIYVPVVTLSTHDNAKLLAQLKSGFKRQSVGINIYQNLNNSFETSFQGVNRPLVLAFEDDAQRKSNKRYYLPNVEIKDYNVMINEKSFWSTSKK